MSKKEEIEDFLTESTGSRTGGRDQLHTSWIEALIGLAMVLAFLQLLVWVLGG